MKTFIAESFLFSCLSKAPLIQSSAFAISSAIRSSERKRGALTNTSPSVEILIPKVFLSERIILYFISKLSDEFYGRKCRFSTFPNSYRYLKNAADAVPRSKQTRNIGSHFFIYHNSVILGLSTYFSGKI